MLNNLLFHVLTEVRIRARRFSIFEIRLVFFSRIVRWAYPPLAYPLFILGFYYYYLNVQWNRYRSHSVFFTTLRRDRFLIGYLVLFVFFVVLLITVVFRLDANVNVTGIVRMTTFGPRAVRGGDGREKLDAQYGRRRKENRKIVRI